MTTWKRLTTSPGAQEPVTADDFLAFGRVTDQAELPVIERLVKSARQEIERHTGLVLVPGTFQVTVDEWAPALEIPLAPIQSVDQVRYLSWYAGGVTVVDASTYAVDLVGRPGRVAFPAWRTRPWGTRNVAGIELEVTAGFEPEDVPEDVRQHVLNVALMGFQFRDDPEMLTRIRRYAAEGADNFGMVLL